MSLAAVLIGLFVLTYGALAVIAYRRPLLARLAYREAVRRPWQSVLVVAGLTVGTSMILMSAVNSDSMSETLTSATYQSWGRVDLLVTANGGLFSRGVAARLAADPLLHNKVRGVQAGDELVGTVADLDRRLDNPTVRLIGFDPAAQPPFGLFTLADGRRTAGLDLGPDEVLLSKRLADSVLARRGDTVRVAISGRPSVDFTIAGIATPQGPGAYGGQPAMFATLTGMSELTGTDGINVIRVSAPGDGALELDNGRRLAPAVASALGGLPSNGGLVVRTAKADDIDEVVKLADDNRPVTLALSAIIVLAGIALVVNLALALAEERRPRLAILRAMGLSRVSLVMASVLEGAVYSLAAAAIGALPGIAAGWLLVSQAGKWVPEIHEKNATVLFVVSTDAIAVSIAAGTLITLTTLLIASVRTSRLSIASAVRALPEPPLRRRPSRVSAGGIVAIGVVGLIAVVLGDTPQRLVGGLGVIALVGLLMRGRMPNQARATVVGAAAALWVAALYSRLGIAELTTNVWITVAAIAFSIGALSMVVAANMRFIERIVPRSLVAQLTRQPSKLLLATGSLGLVMAMVAFIGVFLATISPDYRKDSGGYDVSVSSTGATSVDLPPSLQSKVNGELSVASRAYFGPITATSSDRGPGPIGWHQQMTPLYELSDAQLSAGVLPFSAREARFSNDAAVWAALREDPTVVVSGVFRPGTIVTLMGIAGPVDLRVIGAFKPGLFAGLMGSTSAMEPFAATPAGRTLMLKLKSGVDPAAFALDVRRSLFPSGVEAVTTQALLEDGWAAARNFAAEGELLLITGLAVGVLSLGLLALRAVVERRRSIGVLRAIGFQPKQLMLAVMGESLLMATGGIVVGMVVGLGLGYLFVNQYFPGGQAGFQGVNLSVAAVLVYLTAAGVTVGPALAVARTAPAEALRMAD